MIETLTVLSGSIKPQALVDALRWARTHRKTSRHQWLELNP